MKYWTGGYYLIIKIMPIVPGHISSVSIEYKYNYWKVLGFIDNKGGGITNESNTYLYHFSDNHPSVYILLFVNTCIIRKYLNTCNAIGQKIICVNMT